MALLFTGIKFFEYLQASLFLDIAIKNKLRMIQRYVGQWFAKII